MTNPAPQSSPQRFQRVRALFERAQSLPLAQRDAFVRAQAAGDETLASEVLTLLKRSDADTAGFAGAARRDFEKAVNDGVVPPRDGADHVQSTATGELMEKLSKAPKLDEERYAIETEVGKGGMGAVMRIHDRHLNRRLAMKVLLERAAPRDEEEKKLVHQLLGRFLEEAQVTSQLDHPGVVPVHELGLDQRGKVYFTMRLVKGRTASEVFALARRDAEGWTTTRALEVVLKVCDTMAYAHDKGVLHRDLKPSNVMVGRFGEVYVMDWGLAKVLGQADRHDLRIRKDQSTGLSKIDSARKRDAEGDASSSVVSMDGQQLGTPSYMPPEQARSETLDARADVYAIGAMMYELLTGRAPYTAPGVRPSPYRILNEVIDGPPKRIESLEKGVPAELIAIVERAMCRERDGRYRTVLELASDVRAFLAQRVVKAYRTGAMVEMKLWVRRNRALASSLAAAVLILVSGVVLVTMYARRADARASENARLLEAEKLTHDRSQVFETVAKLRVAQSIEESLYPAFPDKVPAMEAWLRNFGEPLAARLPDMEVRLVALQKRSAPMSEDQRAAARQDHGRWPELLRRRAELEIENEPGRRVELLEMIRSLEFEIGAAGYEFEDSADTYVHRVLLQLVGELRAFVGSQLPKVRMRLGEGQTVRQKTIDACRGKWDEAISAIKASDGKTASKLYEHCELTPQIGLVPIGMDPMTLLWEFVHPASGTVGKEIPQRDPATQRLIPTGDMGIVFVLLPGGTLPTYLTEDEGEKKRQSVRLDPFFLGKYKMTQGQWLRLTGTNPSDGKDANNLALPVESVNWFESEEVLRHEGMVLPSELRWEYAMCAGTPTKWKRRTTRERVEDDGREQTTARSRTEEAFGINGMFGGPWEWCLDVHGNYGTERNGDGLRPGPDGGSSTRSIFIASSWFPERTIGSPTYRSELGLRAARTLRL